MHGVDTGRGYLGAPGVSVAASHAGHSLFSSRNGRLRSIRNELRHLFLFVISGIVVQTWATIGQFTMKEVLNGFMKVTRFAVMRCFFAWALWAVVLAVYLWERRYARRHYSKAEWCSSLQTLDSFDAGEDWSKVGPDLLLRGAALGYRDPGVTPYIETYGAPSYSKGYDAPPSDSSKDSPLESLVTTSAGPHATEPDGPEWKAALARGDYVLGPDLSRKRGMEPPEKRLEKAPAVFYELPELPRKGEPSYAESAVRCNQQPKRWVPEDRYWSEKAQIIEQSFGSTLTRTRSM